jgi:hypothetical protein
MHSSHSGRYCACHLSDRSSSGAGWICQPCKSSAKTWIDLIRFVRSVGHGYADRNPCSAAAHRVTPNAGSILDPGGNLVAQGRAGEARSILTTARDQLRDFADESDIRASDLLLAAAN